MAAPRSAGTPQAPPATHLPTKPVPIIYYHAGAGFQVTYETGQDSTQASPNGLDEYRIARLDQGPNTDRYYLRETRFQPPLRSGSPAIYEVRGPAPFFWASLDAIDDSLPVVGPGVFQEGWVTLYHPQGRPANDFLTFGTPIWFKGSPTRRAGILMIGNELQTIPTANPLQNPDWNKRLVAIPEGHVTARMRISLAAADPAGSFAGLMFRRTIPQGNGVTMDAAYGSAGYFLNVNNVGGLELLRSDGGGGLVCVWHCGQIHPVVQQKVNTAAGVLIEVRTNNKRLGDIDVWIEGNYVGTYQDMAPLLGPHVGLIADAGFDARFQVKFSERQVFDVGLEMVSKYSGYPDGRLVSSVIVRNARRVTVPHTLYRANLVAFLNVPHRPTLNTIWTEDTHGTVVDPPIQNGCYLPRLLGRAGGTQPPRCLSSSLPYALCAGEADGSPVLCTVPTRADIDGQPSQGPHALLAAPATLIHLNALDFEANETPLSAKEIRLQSIWRLR